MNHYRYLSTTEQQEKANENGNTEVGVNELIDQMTNEVKDTGIQYIIPSLTKAMKHHTNTSQEI
jgi:hypothetical protein